MQKAANDSDMTESDIQEIEKVKQRLAQLKNKIM